MGYDFAVWEGPRPGDDEQAANDCERMLVEFDKGRVAPTAAIGAFIGDVLSAYPDIDEDADDFPWKYAPLQRHAVSGPTAYLTLHRVDSLDEILDSLTDLAAKHNLNAFDPQKETMVAWAS